MKTLLFIDTETSCFASEIGVNMYNRPCVNENGEVVYPHISQISWIITSKTGKEIVKRDFIILPEGYEISKNATSVHGITNEIAHKKGISIRFVIDVLKQDIEENKCYKICGHNVKFDIHSVEAECLRLGYTDLFEALVNFHYEDTCGNSKIMHYVGGRDSRGRIKKPKLIELYTKLFNEGFEGAHDSMADIEATKKCYFECVKLGLIDQYD